jgi:hypothetical protein
METVKPAKSSNEFPYQHRENGKIGSAPNQI